MNVTIGIHIEVDPRGFQKKYHIDGCSQSAFDADVCRIFTKYLIEKLRRGPFKVKLCENAKNIYFLKHPLRVSLRFGLRVSFIFLQGYRKV